jgi:cyanide dihydratase
MATYPKYKVAATQLGPVYLNLDATIDKACNFIREAASNGARIIGFPEAYISGYPWWIWLGAEDKNRVYFRKLLENAVTENDGALARISECARENKIYVCIAGHERSGDSVYMTQFWFDDLGNFLGKHRKMKATAAERRVWTDGDGSTMGVYHTNLGILGSLECAEHNVPAYHAVLGSQGEQVHVTGYPPLPVELAGSMGLKGPLCAVKSLCVENKCFAIMSCQVINQDVIDMLCGDDENLINKMPTAISNHGGLGGGFACVINPHGQIISGDPLDPMEEGIVYGEIDLAECIQGKQVYDVYENAKEAGVMHLVLDRKRESSMVFSDEQPNDFVSFEDFQAAAE